MPRLSSSYQEALTWLYRLQFFGIKLGLESTHRLLDGLHIDLGPARVLHVAGTNGKGSVCAMIDSICRAQGYRSGLFTSPHLVTFRERIRINGEMISEEAVTEGLTRVRQAVANWDPHPTFFEITTALALQYFARQKLDVIVLETGLGGRLDATNAVQSHVSVITPIDLDHQKWLGHSLEEIANEKAGIIKPKIPVISAVQKPEAETVLQKRATECEAPLEFVTEDYGQTSIGLRGAHQKQNAALAVAALRASKIEIDESAIAHGLLSVEWPARFQRWDENTIIDGAHNPASARILAETWRETFGNQRATLILAILSDKDLPGICETLVSISEFVLLPQIRSERAALTAEIAQILSSINSIIPHSITPTLADALKIARTKPNPILITGSLHFAGEALAYLRGQPAAFEECTQ